MHADLRPSAPDLPGTRWQSNLALLPVRRIVAGKCSLPANFSSGNEERISNSTRAVMPRLVFSSSLNIVVAADPVFMV